MNFVQVIFCLLSSGLIIVGSLINFLEPRLPTFLPQCFRYGKFAAKEKSRFALEVPKSWFRHFYLSAIIIYTYVLWLIVRVYLFNWDIPEWVSQGLDLLCGEDRVAYTPKINVCIAVLLMTVQVYRRFYDTHFVSVFGGKAKINLSHYTIGLIFYPGTALAILCEAPLFAFTSFEIEQKPLSLLALPLSDKLVIFLFMVAWKHQHICTKILGNLRKNKTGEVISDDYKLPEGDWFDYLSAPHQTSEIIMYSCLMWLLWNNITWFFVYAWVITNQVETILLTHWWYQEKFNNFPRKRKALIPFLY